MAGFPRPRSSVRPFPSKSVVVASPDPVRIIVHPFRKGGVGTWKLNLAKGKYNAGTAPRSSTVVIATAGKGFKVTWTLPSPERRTTKLSPSSERPTAPPASGKTLTTAAKGTNAAGGNVDNVQVYDKQ